jgi:Zn-dependent peptidase ImmA (M78 family)
MFWTALSQRFNETDMAASFKRAQAEAERLLAKYRIEKPPIDPEAIAEAEGVGVVYSHFHGRVGEELAGFSQRYPHPRIIVNAEMSAARKTFTIAHELGHHILHSHYVEDEGNYRVLPRRNEYGDEGKPDEEKEADAFAANLLVPLRMLKRYKDFASPSELANMFLVSKDMMLHRLKWMN